MNPETIPLSFSEIGVTSCFIKRLEDRFITKPTDIQCKIVPMLAAGQNVFFTSATGTGKTFAYLLPILNSLLEQQNEPGVKPYTMIVAPTLELCTQIKNELDFLLTDLKISSSLLIGSASLERQIEELRKKKSDIIVGNPNRLLILARKGLIKLNNLRFLVLDEADRLVSEEMLDDTNELCEIVFYKNKIRPVITACSATINSNCREKLLITCKDNNIPFVESNDHEILREKIEHWAIFSEKRRKDQTLRSLLSALKTNPRTKKTGVKALVFTSRNDEALFVFSRLQHHNVPVSGLFGKVNKKAISSEDRKAALDSFRDGKVLALVSTDLAARGLDIPGITHVIALDVPSDSEVYIHRCGRTGRAGKRGVMVTIGDETQMRLLAMLEKKLKIVVYPKELHYGKVCAPVPMEG
ncbi:MAG: DEAD/DEAH box helicase [Treponema sp.]|jgi:superfamily II DNA/RNA helicase|nr:DEAD/DEAH box helicase [Treponema sp.]